MKKRNWKKIKNWKNQKPNFFILAMVNRREIKNWQKIFQKSKIKQVTWKKEQIMRINLRNKVPIKTNIINKEYEQPEDDIKLDPHVT